MKAMVFFACLLCIPGCKGKGRSPSPPPASPAPPRPEPRAQGIDFSALPVGTRLIATGDVQTIVAAAAEAKALFPRLVPKEETVEALIRKIYGVDLTRTGPNCLFAWIADAGGLLWCDQGQASPPPGAELFVNGEAQGYTVKRGEIAVAVGTWSGRLLAGSPAAVEQVIKVARRAWPGLSREMVEAISEASSLAALDRRRPISIYFPRREWPPWCVQGCLSTAVFLDPAEGGVIAARTPSPEAASIVGQALSAFWTDKVSRPFTSFVNMPRSERPFRVQDEVIKLAYLPATAPERADRGEVAALRVKGDCLALALAFRPDLLWVLLGEPGQGL